MTQAKNVQLALAAGSGAEVAHLSCGIVHLGEIAYRTGKTLHFDAQQERVVGDDAADALLTKEYRGPWAI